MRFSIVIPLHRATPESRRCLTACLELDHADFEVVVVTDRPVDLPEDRRLRTVLTGAAGNTSPAEKRDVAFPHATGDAIAYLDDDAYPRADWLSVAEREFRREGTHAIGGPGLTPPGSSLSKRIGGATYESALGSGPLRYRFAPAARRIVDDYPAYNLIVRTAVVADAGGWASTFYGGEDTVFCESLARLGIAVHYVPELVVYHHRRAIFRPHARQIRNVGRHRGYFARVRPATSRRVAYFLPAIGVVAAPMVGIALCTLLGARRSLLAGTVAHMLLALASPLPAWRERLLFPAALVNHHLSYGLGFWRGFLTRRMTR